MTTNSEQCAICHVDHHALGAPKCVLPAPHPPPTAPGANACTSESVADYPLASVERGHIKISVKVTEANGTAWFAPFCANAVDNCKCPKCESRNVRVREKEIYSDGEEVEAYCANCHARLLVYAAFEVTFGDVELDAQTKSPCDGCLSMLRRLRRAMSSSLSRAEPLCKLHPNGKDCVYFAYMCHNRRLGSSACRHALEWFYRLVSIVTRRRVDDQKMLVS